MKQPQTSRTPARRNQTPEHRPDLTVIENDIHLPSGGVLLPDYDSEVKEMKLVDYNSCRHGVTQSWEVIMDDGTRYDLRRGIPKDLKSNVEEATSVPWWTSLDQEHNQKIIRSALWRGSKITMAGAPKGWGAKDVSLSKAAYDLHRILDAEEPDDNIDPKLAIIHGASRPAMMGFALLIDKYARGRKIPYADFVDPCVPRRFTKKEWVEAVAHVGPELGSLLGIGVEYTLRGQIGAYISSLLPKDPTHVPNAIRIFPGLVAGEVGTLADAADKETAMHILGFSGNPWHQHQEWVDRYKDRTNVLVEEEDGTHIGGIARTKTRRDTNARLIRIRDIRGVDGSFDKIDFANDVLRVTAETFEGRVGKQALQAAA